jgi:hypothetical protein
MSHFRITTLRSGHLSGPLSKENKFFFLTTCVKHILLCVMLIFCSLNEKAYSQFNEQLWILMHEQENVRFSYQVQDCNNGKQIMLKIENNQERDVTVSYEIKLDNGDESRVFSGFVKEAIASGKYVEASCFSPVTSGLLYPIEADLRNPPQIHNIVIK